MVTLRSSRLGLILGFLALTGCSLSPTLPSGSIPHLKGIGGNIRGGQQPVSGATIQLYTVGTTGDGSAATPMLTSTVTSDANGNFQFGGLFSCTNATLVYLTATGGDPGLGANNPNLSLMTAIGSCTSITANTFVMIDERTTVAAVSALAHFIGAAGSANIGSSPTDVSALTAAFTLASELVDPSTGETPGQNVPTGMTVPSAEINTLADVLSTCINSAGGVAGDSSACGNLFSLTTPTSATAPTNTLAALLNVANNPTLNTTALYNLAPGAGAPFQPELTTAPPDFQVRLTQPASSMALQFNPTSIVMPDTPVGFAAPAIQETITNKSSGDVTINSIGLLGPSAADFSQTNTCIGVLFSGNTCTVEVMMTPSALGARNAYLSIISSSADSPQYVALTGNGVAATAGPVSVSPTTLPTFTLAGSSQSITLSNLGSTPLTISSITSSDPSFIPTSNCGTMLPAQSVCTISVQSVGFQDGLYPESHLQFNGTLIIDDNASSGPQKVQLQSNNTAQVTNFSGSNNQNSFDLGTWGVGSPGSKTFSYSTGWNGQSGSFTNGTAGDFSTSGCTAPAPDGSVCSFTVKFTPSAIGVRTGNINGIVFSGTGQSAGPSFIVGSVPLWQPSYLTNTTTSTGTSNMLVTNNGTTSENFSYSFSGPNAGNFTLQSPSCTTLAPGANCTVTFNFTATSIGTYSSVLSITDTSSSISKTVPLSTEVYYSPPIVQPNPVQFADQPLGVTSAAQTITISDINNKPLGHPLSISLAPSSNFTLPAGSTCPASTTQLCTLSVAFDPYVLGGIQENLKITDLTTGVSSVPAQLQGTGGTPAVSLSPGSVTFPARSLGTTSIPVTVTLTNTGTQQLNVKQVNVVGAVNGNFTETNNCTSVNAGGTCSINVSFAPTAAGPQSATVQIVSNSVSSPDIINVSGTTD